jgi:glycosyltransferase involved in cell wall biosynthesis
MTQRVSVVIACLDAADTLGVQLEALTRQDCAVPWNVVVSDNGSRDGSTAVAESFAGRLPGLKVVDSSTRRGPGHARNVGAEASEAELLVFCDADDEVAPSWLSTMVRALGEHSFVAGRFEGTRLNRPAVRRSRPLPQTEGLQYSPFGLHLPHAGSSSLGVRSDVFFGVHGFDPLLRCLEDTDLCWRIQLSGVPLVFVPDALLHVRLRSSLPEMWRQGHDYGAAAALLARRYASVRRLELAGEPPETEPDPADGAPGRGGVRGRLGALSRRHLSLRGSGIRNAGGLLWSAGWHLGWREGLRSTEPTGRITRMNGVIDTTRADQVSRAGSRATVAR